MSAKSARREYLEAVAEFQRGIAAFSAGMGRIIEPSATEAVPVSLLDELRGPRKPAKRAERETGASDMAKRRQGP